MKKSAILWGMAKPLGGIRGSAMGVVLMVAAIALLAAFTAAGVSTMGLRVSSRVHNAAAAQALAESVVAEAAARLQLDLGFHSSIELDDEPDLPQGTSARLSFERDSDFAYSTNNFLDDNSQGWKRTLPNHTAHLIGRGESGGVVRHVEVLLHLPEFPVALACDGPVLVTNSLITAFEPEKERAWVPGSGFSVDEDETRPGNLITNSVSGDACILDPNTKITGDLQARGGIRLNGATVEGEVRSPWGQDAPLPKFEIEKFDPQNSPNTYYEDLGSVAPALTLIGTTRHQGDLNLNSLKLDNGFLFVNGNLTVKGALQGVGTVVVSGMCRFKGAVNVRSNEQVAVLSGGGIEAVGESSDRSIFQGLLYTKGPFIAKKLTIMGGFIVDDGSPTQIADSSIFYSQTHVSPHMKREVFAVVPRFVLPQNLATPPVLFSDPETLFPTGNWPLPGKTRTVANVLDQDEPGWARSRWHSSDPAVLSVAWVDDKPIYTYTFWGLNDDINDDIDDVSNPLGAVLNRQSFASAEELARELAAQNSSQAAKDNLRDTDPPNPAAYEAYILQVAEHLRKAVDDRDESNYRIDPNEFISDGENIRVMYRRVF